MIPIYDCHHQFSLIVCHYKLLQCSLLLSLSVFIDTSDEIIQITDNKERARESAKSKKISLNNKADEQVHNEGLLHRNRISRIRTINSL